MQKRYICVGCSSGKVFVIAPQKSSFVLLQTLDTQGQPISATAGLMSTKSKNTVRCRMCLDVLS